MPKAPEGAKKPTVVAQAPVAVKTTAETESSVDVLEEEIHVPKAEPKKDKPSQKVTSLLFGDLFPEIKAAVMAFTPDTKFSMLVKEVDETSGLLVVEILLNKENHEFAEIITPEISKYKAGTRIPFLYSTTLQDYVLQNVTVATPLTKAEKIAAVEAQVAEEEEVTFSTASLDERYMDIFQNCAKIPTKKVIVTFSDLKLFMSTCTDPLLTDEEIMAQSAQLYVDSLMEDGNPQVVSIEGAGSVLVPVKDKKEVEYVLVAALALNLNEGQKVSFTKSSKVAEPVRKEIPSVEKSQPSVPAPVAVAEPVAPIEPVVKDDGTAIVEMSLEDKNLLANYKLDLEVKKRECERAGKKTQKSADYNLNKVVTKIANLYKKYGIDPTTV